MTCDNGVLEVICNMCKAGNTKNCKGYLVVEFDITSPFKVIYPSSALCVLYANLYFSINPFFTICSTLLLRSLWWSDEVVFLIDQSLGIHGTGFWNITMLLSALPRGEEDTFGIPVWFGEHLNWIPNLGSAILESLSKGTCNKQCCFYALHAFLGLWSVGFDSLEMGGILPFNVQFQFYAN
jgi:hypothetical protein